METALRKAGFTVMKVENASLRDMSRLVRGFGDRLKADGGVGLFMFADARRARCAARIF